MWAAIHNLWRSRTFWLAIVFALAVTAAITLVLVLIHSQVVRRDTNQLDRVLVAEAAAVVDRPLPQLQREVELRLTRDVRQLDFAAIFDAGGKLIAGNVAELPPDLPVDGAGHVLPMLTEAHHAFEPALVVARRRQDGGVLLLGRNLYDVYAFRLQSRPRNRCSPLR